MNKPQFINYNGQLYKKDERILTAANRAFRYGDSLFETMHALGGEIQFFTEHHIRLISSMDKLKMTVPGHFVADRLKGEITRLLNKNLHFKGARVRLSIMRKDGGLYLPTDNDVDYLIETALLGHDHYELNAKGLKIDLFDEIRKDMGYFSNLKTGSALLPVMAGIYCREEGLDDCVVLNSEGRLCEGVASNLFILKGNKLLTPSLQDGCVSGIMRDQVNFVAATMGLAIDDEALLKPLDLENADEIFMTNAIKGIQWVQAYRRKRYYHKITQKILNKLNKLAFEQD
jgi:branched-subunit amino acid aminotransferase/4-amino-4-deoxychorismate lyase